MKKTRSNTFILEKEIAWEPAGEGVVRQIMGYDGQVMLVKVKFEQGAIGTPHTHYHTQTTRVPHPVQCRRRLRFLQFVFHRSR